MHRLGGIQWAECRPAWKVFRIEFEIKYIFYVIRDRKDNEFVQLVQGQMSVSKYEAKFNSMIVAHVTTTRVLIMLSGIVLVCNSHNNPSSRGHHKAASKRSAGPARFARSEEAAEDPCAVVLFISARWVRL